MSETQDFTACPHWGHGGRYVLDPATGERKPVTDDSLTAPEPEATVIPADPLSAVASDAAASTEKTAKKGK